MQNVLYIVINEDLNMSPGKIGAHTAHAVLDYLLMTYDKLDDEYGTFWGFIGDYKEHGDTIIVLKAHEKDLLKWESEGFAVVRDKGLTEVEPDSITAVCLGVFDKDKGIPKWIQRLRLL